jgi:hypothetical protein
MWLRIQPCAVLCALALGVCACASGWENQARGPVAELSPLQAELGFVRATGASRADIETRLGPPSESFEAGRIVAYAVVYDDGQRRLALMSAKADSPLLERSVAATCFGLMIEYSPDGAVVRHALVRQGSARCPKAMPP